MLSSVAVHRYLQASSSAMHRGQAQDVGPTPPASEVASIDRVVTSLTAMPGVATASCVIATSTPASAPEASAPESPAANAPATPPGSPAAATPTATATPTAGAFSYEISVIMNPDSTSSQATDVVFNMTKQLQNSHVDLELSSPAGNGHAESVVDYRNAFDAPVARSTVAAVSQAVSVAAGVPGVSSVHVTVPYTWNVAAGGLQVEFASGASQRPAAAALKTALQRTALSGVEWSSAPDGR
jgi:hypothetical protein